MRQYFVKCKKCGRRRKRPNFYTFVCESCKLPNKHQSRTFYHNKRIVLLRDLNRCQCCGGKKRLDAHHLDGDRKNNSVSNLITICRDCHYLLHLTYTKEQLRASIIYNLFPSRFRWGKHGKKAVFKQPDDPIEIRQNRFGGTCATKPK
ncbi:MAG: hypothetical protein KCHDKBKB_00610 [Elusimicrobia bacterium]|nr:hypothetical protein [Elusimicrobiota bacterium]